MQPFDDEPKSRVLVIDEDQRTADSLAFALDIFGFRATAAYTGQQAMKFAAVQSFHFVVSDALAEINGVKAPLAISVLFPDCKVLFMSSNADSVQFIDRLGRVIIASTPSPSLVIQNFWSKDFVDMRRDYNHVIQKLRNELLRWREVYEVLPSNSVLILRADGRTPEIEAPSIGHSVSVSVKVSFAMPLLQGASAFFPFRRTEATRSRK